MMGQAKMKWGGLGIALVALVAVIAVGWGGGDDGDGGDAGTEATQVEFTDAEVEATIEVDMGDFVFLPKDAKGPAGIDEVLSENIGAFDHELYLFETDIDPGSLTLDPETDKADMSPMGEKIFENFATPGESDSHIADLAPGQYAMICNLPGHYAAGMWGSLTIK